MENLYMMRFEETKWFSIFLKYKVRELTSAKKGFLDVSYKAIQIKWRQF